MNERQTQAMIDEIYDTTKEDTMLSMVGQLYSRRMLPSLLVTGVYCLPFFGLAVYCGIKFFDTQPVQFPLMYAAIFICCVHVIFLRKALYWQMLQKNSVSREVKRLEARIVEQTGIVEEMKIALTQIAGEMNARPTAGGRDSSAIGGP